MIQNILIAVLQKLSKNTVDHVLQSRYFTKKRRKIWKNMVWSAAVDMTFVCLQLFF